MTFLLLRSDVVDFCSNNPLFSVENLKTSVGKYQNPSDFGVKSLGFHPKIRGIFTTLHRCCRFLLRVCRIVE